MTKYPVVDDTKQADQNIVYNNLAKDVRAADCWPVFRILSVVKTGFPTLTSADNYVKDHLPADIPSDQINSTDELPADVVAVSPSSSPQKRHKRSQGWLILFLSFFISHVVVTLRAVSKVTT